MRRLLVVSLTLSTGCFGSCVNPVVQQGTCVPSGAAGQVDTLELGGSDEAAFQPLTDGDAIETVRGGQGATMVVVRLRVTGASAPACLAQSTVVTLPLDNAVDIVARSDAALATNPDDGGGRSTAQLLLPGGYPQPGQGIVITTQAGGRTTTRLLSVGVPGFFDFAPAPDGGDEGDASAVEDLAAGD